jgi:hypothetical protein
MLKYPKEKCLQAYSGKQQASAHKVPLSGPQNQTPLSSIDPSFIHFERIQIDISTPKF